MAEGMKKSTTAKKRDTATAAKKPGSKPKTMSRKPSKRPVNAITIAAGTDTGPANPGIGAMKLDILSRPPEPDFSVEALRRDAAARPKLDTPKALGPEGDIHLIWTQGVTAFKGPLNFRAEIIFYQK